MRTVDPDSWRRSVKNPSLHLARPWKFGRPGITGFESRLRQSFSQAMREWRLSSSTAFAKYVFNEDNTLFESVCLVVFAAGCAAAGAWLAAAAARAGGPGRWLRPAPAPLSAAVPFPAVAFCSYNLISRKKLLDFLDDLYYEEEFNVSAIEAVGRNAAQFATLITTTQLRADADFLALVATIPRKDYNVTEILYSLSPGCGSLAARCLWRGVATACGGLLAPRLTPYGFCCVFNGRFLPEDMNTPVKYLDQVGPERGLTVYLKEDSDDFVFLRGLTEGTEVFVFESSQFPVPEAGALRSFSVPRASAVYCELTVQLQRTSPAMHHSEQQCREYGAGGAWEQVSHGHCVAACRRRAAAALCGCVPPALQHTSPAPAATCSLPDVVCLNKHRGKFMFFQPKWAGSARELQEEAADSLDCDCPPPCAAAHYRLRVYSSRDRATPHKLYRNPFTARMAWENMSVVKIYFDTESQEQYSVEPYSHFSQDIAMWASVWLCVTSLGAAPLLELLYFSVVRVALLLARSVRPVRPVRPVQPVRPRHDQQ